MSEEKTVVTLMNAAGQRYQPEPIVSNFARPVPGRWGQKSDQKLVAREQVPSPSVIPISHAEGRIHQRETFARNVNSHSNPLLNAASPLLNRFAILVVGSQMFEIGSFRDWCTSELSQFDQYCGQAGLKDEMRHYANYILCTVMDEFVNKTHWGHGFWSSQSLLSQYHGETDGGEKFFHLLSFLQQAPANNLYLLELIYVCLGLGFEGKYRLDEKGYTQLEILKDDLLSLIRSQKSEPEQELSPNWRPQTRKQSQLIRYVPVWVVAVIASVILLSSYSGYAYLLDVKSQQLIDQISEMSGK